MKTQTGELQHNGQNVRVGKDCPNVFRTTFHPDTDYASFVGCYKPTMRGDTLVYEFVEQIFTLAYVYALRNPETQTYLVIEEINRGNCAQIFGDLFQLLDRGDDGQSEYAIRPDRDLMQHLKRELGNKLPGDTIRLPANFYIYATMNTSDQSLFPMDSAFKRRWDWCYVPIETHSAAGVTIELANGEVFSWGEFIEKVNGRIREATASEDKQIGRYFFKGDSILEDDFVSKVMFYLWAEICKELVGTELNFFRYKKTGDNGKIEEKEFSFNDLFSQKGTLAQFMRYLGLEPLHRNSPTGAHQTQGKVSLKDIDIAYCSLDNRNIESPMRKFAYELYELYLEQNPDKKAPPENPDDNPLLEDFGKTYSGKTFVTDKPTSKSGYFSDPITIGGKSCYVTDQSWGQAALKGLIVQCQRTWLQQPVYAKDRNGTIYIIENGQGRRA